MSGEAPLRRTRRLLSGLGAGLQVSGEIRGRSVSVARPWIAVHPVLAGQPRLPLPGIALDELDVVRPSCLLLLTQRIRWPFSLALARAGSSRPARIRNDGDGRQEFDERQCPAPAPGGGCGRARTRFHDRHVRNGVIILLAVKLTVPLSARKVAVCPQNTRICFAPTPLAHCVRGAIEAPAPHRPNGSSLTFFPGLCASG